MRGEIGDAVGRAGFGLELRGGAGRDGGVVLVEAAEGDFVAGEGGDVAEGRGGEDGGGEGEEGEVVRKVHFCGGCVGVCVWVGL